MVPARNNTECFSFFNHFAETIHHRQRVKDANQDIVHQRGIFPATDLRDTHSAKRKLIIEKLSFLFLLLQYKK